MGKRQHKVAVFLDDDELDLLDGARCAMRRGHAIRLLLLGALPRPIPSINIKLHSDLGRALGNLSSIATISRRGGFVQESELLPVLHELRALLISAKTQIVDDESGE